MKTKKRRITFHLDMEEEITSRTSPELVMAQGAHSLINAVTIYNGWSVAAMTASIAESKDG